MIGFAAGSLGDFLELSFTETELSVISEIYEIGVAQIEGDPGAIRLPVGDHGYAVGHKPDDGADTCSPDDAPGAHEHGWSDGGIGHQPGKRPHKPEGTGELGIGPDCDSKGRAKGILRGGTGCVGDIPEDRAGAEEA